MRMFLQQRDEFTDWKLSQDIVWEKHNGSNRSRDRFRRIHEYATHWYQSDWASLYHDTPRTMTGVDRRSRVGHSPDSGAEHLGKFTERTVWVDNGTRLMTSVIRARSMHHGAIHPTEKPLGILDPLIRYACPEGGLVVDPFAGSGSTLDAARQSGRHAIGIEARADYCDAAARRLSHLTLSA
jgi:site-specific DNA-methyltransferase (adenine-specific)